MDGNMGAAFSICGPNDYIGASYTGRLSGDPANTIRYPLHVPLQSEFTYASINTGLGLNLWGNYAAIQLDPVDKKTFYVLAQLPDPVGFFNPPGAFGYCNKTAGSCVAITWTTSIYTFQINKNGECDQDICTTPKHTVAVAGKSSNENNSGFQQARMNARSLVSGDITSSVVVGGQNVERIPAMTAAA